ncbi:histidine phosphatase family protein [Gryllotalpicola koreensis]|uniref:Phosphatase PhoE n=1 Tax=Gryllotalpicola koreensis TaxID=993086 RepID=A0ABP7ZY04_9MICO
MTRISLVRHGQTDWNRDGLLQGRTDVPLNDTGREQARETGRALRTRRFDGIYASPLSRAFETAAIIAGELGMPEPVAVPGLEERSYGRAEGMTGPEIREAFGENRADIPEWENDAALLGRVLGALAALSAQHAGERILVVVHGGVIGAIAKHLTGGERPAKGEFVGNGSVHDLEVTGGELTLVRFNVALDELAAADELDVDVELG